jgi:hypothetical protein
MDFTTLIGTIGGVVLVAGAAYPDRPGVRPITSIKDWLFAIGGLLMLVYSVMNYLAGGTVFFVFLQALVNLSSVFMMLDTDDRIDTPIIALGGVVLVAWSLWLLPGFRTVLFVLGLAGIAAGYCSKGGTTRRELLLGIGSAFVAYFSYIEGNAVFFWLNLFFALFSALQLYLLTRPRSANMPV